MPDVRPERLLVFVLSLSAAIILSLCLGRAWGAAETIYGGTPEQRTAVERAFTNRPAHATLLSRVVFVRPEALRVNNDPLVPVRVREYCKGECAAETYVQHGVTFIRDDLTPDLVEQVMYAELSHLWLFRVCGDCTYDMPRVLGCARDVRICDRKE